MTAGTRSPANDPPAKMAPAPFDREVGPAELARIRKLSARGHSPYLIAATLRLRYALIEELIEQMSDPI